MPARAFTARCDACAADRSFEEFSRERRTTGSAQAAARGEFRFEWEYKFRCQTCGTRVDKLVDAKGVLHKWQGSKHVEMPMPK